MTQIGLYQTLYLKFEKIDKFSEKFCNHIWECQKRTQIMKIRIFSHSNFRKFARWNSKFKSGTFTGKWTILKKKLKFWVTLSNFSKIAWAKNSKFHFCIIFDASKYGYNIFAKFELFRVFWELILRSIIKPLGSKMTQKWA